MDNSQCLDDELEYHVKINVKVPMNTKNVLLLMNTKNYNTFLVRSIIHISIF